jgi:hypothetical protein
MKVVDEMITPFPFSKRGQFDSYSMALLLSEVVTVALQLVGVLFGFCIENR